jgi:1-acyl-sn-glycerol-3-phosphate acyltransferase
MLPPDPPGVDPRHRNWVWRSIQFVLQNAFAFWFQYRARGIEKLPAGGALFLINHQSFLDPLLVGVGLRRPVSYLARDSLFRVPIIGWVLRKTYVLPICRESAGTESLRLSINRCRQGYYVGVFPEGTRTRTGEVGDFKPGFVAIARRSGVPVIPVGIAGAFEAYPRGVRIPRPSRIRVVFGDPIEAAEVQRLSERGQEQSFVALVRGLVELCQAEAEDWRARRVDLSQERAATPGEQNQAVAGDLSSPRYSGERGQG